jgi:beta-galactosidase
MSAYPPADRLHLGVAFYPEHWPSDRWPEDIRLMAAAGVNVVRMGDFAWAALQPAPDSFETDWLAEAIEQLAAAGIAVVLATPSASPPPWLIDVHPEVLAVDAAGRRLEIGRRCHGCVSAPAFVDAAVRVARVMAERFGRDERVIGWQIDNEYNRVCHCDICRAEFQVFLRGRYASLDELNRRWSTHYWSGLYDRWEQIPLPSPLSDDAPLLPNPGLWLESRRFQTHRFRSFQRSSIDAIRPFLHEDAWITHNFMTWFGGYDHYELSEDLDLAAWDAYVDEPPHDPWPLAAGHDLTRGFKRRSFWLIETQPGATSWNPINGGLERGELKAIAWQAVGHGADAVLYWQWRSAHGGQEQFHGTFIDQAGQTRPAYDDLVELGREFADAGEGLAGAQVEAAVAVLQHYPSRWSIEGQRHHASFDYVSDVQGWLRPLAARNVPVDVLSPYAPLDGYALVVAPALTVIDAGVAEALDAFVRGGGTLLVTARSGVKDDANALQPMRPPGDLASLAGIAVREHFALAAPVDIEGQQLGQATIWAELVEPLAGTTVEVLARFGAANGWLDSQPALTRQRVGAGTCLYLAAWLDPESRAVLVRTLCDEAGVRPVLETPDGVEAMRRAHPDGRAWLLLVNHRSTPARVEIPAATATTLGAGLPAVVELAGYGTRVLATTPVGFAAAEAIGAKR